MWLIQYWLGHLVVLGMLLRYRTLLITKFDFPNKSKTARSIPQI